MKRNVTLDEISDGMLYESNDMVKVGCNNCEGCSACCRGVGNTIVLDPYDIYQLITNLNQSFENLLANRIELNVVDGIILPNLRMTGEAEQCTFLNEEGRCSIHNLRPGICRLFPLGRYYENGGFKYIHQIYECKKPTWTKHKVRKWLGTPELKRYEGFVNDWHYLLKDLQEIINSDEQDSKAKEISLYMLQNFYMKQYDDANKDFYIQFNERLQEAKKLFE